MVRRTMTMRSKCTRMYGMLKDIDQCLLNQGENAPVNVFSGRWPLLDARVIISLKYTAAFCRAQAAAAFCAFAGFGNRYK